MTLQKWGGGTTLQANLYSEDLELSGLTTPHKSEANESTNGFLYNAYKIIGMLKHGKDNEYDFADTSINGKLKFTRILIQKI